MLHFQTYAGPPNKKSLKDKSVDKFRNYFQNRGEFASRPYDILYDLLTEINKRPKEITELHLEILYTVAITFKIIDKNTSKYTEEFTDEQVLIILRGYISELKTQKFSDTVLHIKKTFEGYKLYNSSKKEKYSFHTGMKILSKERDAQELIKGIISLLFARDYFNIEAIKKFRELVISTEIANDYDVISTFDEDPGNDLWSLFFSDSELISSIFEFYQGLVLAKDESLLFYVPPLEKDGKINEKGLYYVFLTIYFRFILAISIFLIEVDSRWAPEKISVIHPLMKIYRCFDLFIFSHIYKYLSVPELLLFSNIGILNDICAHFHDINSMHGMREVISLASSLSADHSHDDFTKIIEKIVNESLTMLKDGSEFDHIDFLEYFENSKKYGKYFSERGFKRNLSKAIKKMMIDNHINRVRGNGYNRRGYKCPHKKKDSS